MHLGCGSPNQGAPFIHGCANGTTPGHKRSMEEQDDEGEVSETGVIPCNQFSVFASTAPSLHGPWSRGRQLSIHHPVDSWTGPLGLYGRYFSNPAPHFLKNGSILLAYRTDDHKFVERVSIAHADNVLGPYKDHTTAAPAVDAFAEDPFLWQDDRGHWHILMHNMNAIGAHAFSRDGNTWKTSDIEPYDNVVQFTDGTNVSMGRRERPQLLLDASGRPVYFSTGVVDHLDHSYTLVNKIANTPPELSV